MIYFSHRSLINFLCFCATSPKEKKERIEELFVLAEAVANRIAIAFNGKSGDADFAMPWHFYPELFEDKTKELEEQRELAETQKFKAAMDGRVAAWNKRFEEEHKNGS